MSTSINEDSIAVFCNMLMDAITVHPEARPVVIAMVGTLMDNNVLQDAWGINMVTTDSVG